jgi:hypothetical protein
MKRGRVTAIVLLAASGSTALAFGAISASFDGSGTYRVGRDVAPGTYRSLGGSDCYWARLNSISGGLESVVVVDSPQGPTLVRIKRTDKVFETSGCARWTSNLARITRRKTRFGPGAFLVGVDIAPGRYRARGGPGCYWARVRSFTGEIASVISADRETGTAIVRIARTERGFTSRRCGTWSRL